MKELNRRKYEVPWMEVSRVELEGGLCTASRTEETVTTSTVDIKEQKGFDEIDYSSTSDWDQN